MDSCRIQLTATAEKYGNLYVSSCRPGFFPKDVYGASSAKKGTGTPVTLQVYGLANPVKTDIPRDKKLFRHRAWVKEFVRVHNLMPGDRVIIRRINNLTYTISPEKKVDHKYNKVQYPLFGLLETKSAIDIRNLKFNQIII